MRPRGVIIGDPFADLLTGGVETEEQALVQQLVSHSAVERLAEAVPYRLAGRDVMPLELVLLARATRIGRCFILRQMR